MFVADDRERTRPVGAPQASVDAPGVAYASGYRMFGNGSCESVYALPTLSPVFARLAMSGTFGKSGQVSG